MLSAAPLSTIIALARAGALEHAWYAFAAAGYDARGDDPAALNVKGRLLKDKALRARGDERRRFYLRSAEAYRRSAALQPGTYPLINAATLSLLSGEPGQAAEIAREVLDRIAREPEEPETPYWRSATEAEALLLTGRSAEARAKLEAAIEAAPRAWEDHASTLRQFLLIHDALGADALWLDLLRPPRSLAYRGGGGGAEEAPDGAGQAAAELIARERIGFGFGGLAAGAEIDIAEALLAAGAELHVILPSDPESFARRCVDRFGGRWRARFDAVLEAAESVHLVRPLATEPDEAMHGLAARVAAGAARLNAERLLSDARHLDMPGSPAVERSPAARPPPLSLLSVSVGGAAESEFESRLQAVREVLDGCASPSISPHLSGDEIVVGFAEVDDAALAAHAIHARLRGSIPLRIAGHHGFIPVVRDPFLGSLRPTESGADILRAIAQATPPDTVCISLDFAATLASATDERACASWIGELEASDGGPALPLYALTPRTSDD